MNKHDHFSRRVYSGVGVQQLGWVYSGVGRWAKCEEAEVDCGRFFSFVSGERLRPQPRSTLDAFGHGSTCLCWIPKRPWLTWCLGHPLFGLFLPRRAMSPKKMMPFQMTISWKISHGKPVACSLHSAWLGRVPAAIIVLAGRRWPLLDVQSSKSKPCSARVLLCISVVFHCFVDWCEQPILNFQHQWSVALTQQVTDPNPNAMQKAMSRELMGQLKSSVRNWTWHGLLGCPSMLLVLLNISGHLLRCLAESRPSGRNRRERERWLAGPP